MLRIGDILDNRYQIVGEIGSGGVGIIYKAYHLTLQKYVVLKKIKDNFVGAINNRAEVDILKKLHHTYLPQVYDFLQIGGQVFTVMDYIEGYDLQKYEDAGTVFTEQQLIIWLKQLLEVLQYLHEHKPPILHTDIKPANIMLTSDNHICLIDFNISLDGEEQMDMQGVSRKYGSPEQLRKADLSAQGLPHDFVVLDGRTDIYSTGITFADLMKNGSYSEALCNIINKAANPEIYQRYKSAEKMLHALNNIEKQDSRYKRYQKISIASRFCFGIIGIISACCMYYGYKTMVKEDYQTAYKSFQTAKEAEADDIVTTEGMDILNQSHFQSFLKKNPRDKTYILHSIGDSFFNEEDYASATEYYREAVDLLSEQNEEIENDKIVLYYRDLVISQARSGSVDEAFVTLEKAKRKGLSGDELNLVEGEIKLGQGKMEEALEILQAVETDTMDKDLKVRAALLRARAYQNNGNTRMAIQVLVEANEWVKDKEILRELGTLYNEQGNQKKAYMAFRELNELDSPTYEDQINLILCEEFLGDYNECENNLKTLIQNYTKDYRLYMYLSRVQLKQALNQSKPDYSSAITNYEKARSYYEREKIKGTSDEGMEELKTWIEEVR